MRPVGTNITLCSTRSTVVATGATATFAGSRRKSSARDAMVFGMVAEKNRLWRSFGSSVTMRFRAWMKPRSSIWSASSRTRISTSRKVRDAAVDEVEEPAGRGDENVDAARELALLLADRHAAEHDGGREPQVAAIGAEAVGDLAGELAGRAEHEDAAALAERAPAGSAARRCRIGSAKAAVLPVPVWAMPQRSRPVMTCGMACVWIGVGVS